MEFKCIHVVQSIILPFQECNFEIAEITDLSYIYRQYFAEQLSNNSLFGVNH